jgi:hypothetical protein
MEAGGESNVFEELRSQSICYAASRFAVLQLQMLHRKVDLLR